MKLKLFRVLCLFVVLAMVLSIAPSVLAEDNPASSPPAETTTTTPPTNAAPVVDAGADSTINAGDTFTSSGYFTDADSSSWTATMDYGDGSGVQPLSLNGKTFTLSHVYSTAGSYTVIVSVTDDEAAVGTGTTKVVVNAPPPPETTTAMATPPTDTTTTTVTSTDTTTTTQPPSDTTTTTVAPPDTTTTTTPPTDTTTTTVASMAPVVNAGPDATINAGDTFTSSGFFADADNTSWTATVDYGDGSGAAALTLNADKTFSLSHVYNAAGSYTITVSVTNDVGATGNGTATVTVAAVEQAELMVTFYATTDANTIQTALDSVGAQVISVLAPIHAYRINVPASKVDEIVASLSQLSYVRRVTKPASMRIAGTPDDTEYAQQWALPKIAWDQAYGSIPITGSATIAIIDTGVDATHPDLAGQILPGYSTFNGGNPNVDSNGHGTALAGIVDADVNNNIGIAGVAYAGVKIIPVQVFAADGSANDFDVIQGIMWAADHGANVILMAFSSAGYSADLADMLQYAWSKGCVLVAATGNDGSTAPTYPAGMPYVLGVSATDQNDALDASSNTGSANVAAPGVDILATLPGGQYGSFNGTSSAAAETAGLAALLVANGQSNQYIYDQIRGASDPVNDSIGRINVLKALGEAVTPPPDPTKGEAPSPGSTPPTYTTAAKSLTVTFLGTGSGSVTLTDTTDSSKNTTLTPGSNSASIGNNDVGTLTANHDANSNFISWSSQTGGITGIGGNPCNFSMGGSAQGVTVTFRFNDNTSPVTASVTSPTNGAIYRATTVPGNFTGSAADNTSGVGLSANSTTFTLQRSSNNQYWNGSTWQAAVANLATTHLATTGGTSVTWTSSATLPTWAGDTYIVKATAIDKNSNTFTGSVVSFTYDGTLPVTASVTSPTNGAIYRAATVPASFTGNAADNSGGVGISANSTTFTLQRSSDSQYWNGSTWQSASSNLATTNAATTGGTLVTWTSSATLPTWAGDTYIVQATATDKAGNTFTGTAVSFSYDNTAPVTASVITPANAAYYRAATVPASFSGSVADNSGGAGLNANSTTFTLQRSSDNNYWTGSTWQASVANLAATHLATTGGTPATWTSNATMPTWVDSSYTVQAIATDKAGNTFTGIAVSFIYDNTVPVISNIIPTDGATVASQATISGNITEANSIASAQISIQNSGGKYWNGSNFVGSQTWVTATSIGSAPNFTFSYDSSSITTPDTYTVTVRATDGAGNTGTSSSISYTITPPTYTVTFTENNLPSGTTWTVTLDTLTPISSTTSNSTSDQIQFTGIPAGQYSWSVSNNISGGTGIRYVANPTGGTLNVNGETTRNINYGTQYQLTMAANFGTTSPAIGSAWYNAGTPVTISATAPSVVTGERYVWNGWTGTGTYSYTGTDNSHGITMNSPVTETGAWEHPVLPDGRFRSWQSSGPGMV